MNYSLKLFSNLTVYFLLDSSLGKIFDYRQIVYEIALFGGPYFLRYCLVSSTMSAIEFPRALSARCNCTLGLFKMCYECNTEGIRLEEKLVPLNVRVPRTLKQLIKDYIELNAHKDVSEFTRDALREKIQRDAPNLYKQLFEAKKEGEIT